MLLDYWLSTDIPRPDVFPPPGERSYLTFDIDPGGLNNIRMAFEYVAILAAVTGRTLVLPPAQPWYLLHHGPAHAGAHGGSCGIGDIFDIDALSRFVPAITTAEFIRVERDRLDIPESVAEPEGPVASGAAPVPSEDLRRWKNWLFDSAHVMPWSPYETLICVPGVEAVMRKGRLTEPFVDHRELVALTPAMQEAPVIHFPTRHPYRQLGQVGAMLACDDPALEVNARRLLKHGVRYVPRVFELAAKLLAALPRDGFSTLHIRRNDFQFSESRSGSQDSLDNIRALLEDGEPLYIATDETEESFFEVFGWDHPVYRWRDLMSPHCGEILSRESLPDELIGPVEQVICATGRVFIGTELSTFTNYITRLRGYMGARDRNAYFHTTRYDRPVAVSPPQYRGRDYLHEWPILWESL